MKKLIFTIAGLTAFVFFLSYISYSSFPETRNNDETIAATAESNITKDSDWVDSFKKVSDYYTPPVEKKPEKKKPKRKPRELTIKDSELVGVVDNPSTKALIIISRQKAIREVKVGEGWVAPWRLLRAETDHVVWLNQKTKEEYVQRLFQ